MPLRLQEGLCSIAPHWKVKGRAGKCNGGGKPWRQPWPAVREVPSSASVCAQDQTSLNSVISACVTWASITVTSSCLSFFAFKQKVTIAHTQPCLPCLPGTGSRVYQTRAFPPSFADRNDTVLANGLDADVCRGTWEKSCLYHMRRGRRFLFPLFLLWMLPCGNVMFGTTVTKSPRKEGQRNVEMLAQYPGITELLNYSGTAPLSAGYVE